MTPTAADGRHRTPAEPPPSPWLGEPGQPPQTPAAPAAPTTPTGGSAWPRPAGGATAGTTLHGLPKRVPLARLPAEAFPEAQDTPSAEDQRDSSQVASVLAAYARGIGGHSSEGASSVPPYPPTTTTGNF
jgi:hypothetical protein